ncbi:MAG: type II secretion system protein, partial [Nitrospinae bacterium]|nr:type II secretion system protein [Nitrospinota bacterium]
MKHSISKNQSGFTLLELIISLAIVGIIIALGLWGVRLGITARKV